MIILSLYFLLIQNRIEGFKVKLSEWLLVYSGALLVFASFIRDYLNILISKNLLSKIFSADRTKLESITFSYVPSNFNWSIFLPGIFLIYLSMYSIFKRTKKTGK